MAEHSAVVENIALVMERARETTMREIKTLCAGERNVEIESHFEGTAQSSKRENGGLNIFLYLEIFEMTMKPRMGLPWLRNLAAGPRTWA